MSDDHHNSVSVSGGAYEPAAGVVSAIRALYVVHNIDELNALLHGIESVVKPHVLSFFNAHAINLLWDNSAFAASLKKSDWLLRDGVGVSIIMRMLGLEPGENMNGTDFIPQILMMYAGKKIAICGTSEPFLTDAAKAIEGYGLSVVHVMDGFKNIEEYVEPLRQQKPDLILLGMGMPKQEAVAELLATQLTHPCLIVNGGAILDFLAERFPRAPLIWQDLRLEWLFRLIHEPKRLWKRYILGAGVLLLRLPSIYAQYKRVMPPVK